MDKELKIKIEKEDEQISNQDFTKFHSTFARDYNDYCKLTDHRTKLIGFDTKYLDYAHYIMTITHNIWEEKGIGVIYDTYSNNVVMHTGSLNINGISGVIAGTMATLHGFPDRKLIGQNVVTTEEEEGIYLSSHRILSTATNTNLSEFGDATDKKVTFRTTVDCLAKENRIFEEWLVRDNYWIVKQLGLDVHDVAYKKALATVNKDGNIVNYGFPESIDGQIYPKRYLKKDNSVGEFIKEVFNNLYCCKDFNKVKEYYSDIAVVNYICDKDLFTHNQIQGMLTSLFSAFPSSEFVIQKIMCNSRKDGKHDVAVRWSLRGYHEGIGLFGAPSGKYVEILGINHLVVEDNKIQKEWVTFDALDVLRQIYVQKIIKGEIKDESNEC